MAPAPSLRLGVTSNFGEYPPTFIRVVQAHILDDAQGGRGWLENASP